MKMKFSKNIYPDIALLTIWRRLKCKLKYSFYTIHWKVYSISWVLLFLVLNMIKDMCIQILFIFINISDINFILIMKYIKLK